MQLKAQCKFRVPHSYQITNSTYCSRRFACVFKAIKKMKDEAFNDTNITWAAFDKRNVKALVLAKYKLTYVQALSIWGLLPYSRFRGTLAKLREAMVPHYRLLFLKLILNLLFTHSIHSPKKAIYFYVSITLIREFLYSCLNVRSIGYGSH